MAGALEGTPAAKPRLSEQANAPRIGRARFIGHAIGYGLIVALIGLGLGLAGLRQTVTIAGQSPPMSFTTLQPIPAIILAAVFYLALLDLVIRRRHDRNRSGSDGAIGLALAFAATVLNVVGLFSAAALWLDGAVALVALYLLVVCAILPGTDGPNRYGADPRSF